jgi:hypothetical protein
MAKRGRHPHSRPRKQRRAGPAARRRPGGGRPGHGASPRRTDLLDEVAAHLHSDQPLDLLLYVSGLLAAVDPRRKNPFDRNADDADHVSLEELTVTFAAVDEPETSALLSCIGQLAADELVRARARRALANRWHPLPEWLAHLGRATVYRAFEMTDPLGDGDDVVLGLRLASGHEFCLLSYVDHNAGTIVKDGFAVPGDADDLMALLRDKSADPAIRFAELDLADARVRIDEAVAAGARTWPAYESDTWPACRPLVEWAARLMPAGGIGYQRREWSDAEMKALAKRFFASEFAAGLGDGDYRSLLADLIRFGADYGPGDPLRWSPVAVEIIMVDWIPRKLKADVEYLARAPRLLRAFIRYCHQERDIRPALTADTLAAVDQHEAEYQQIIRSPRLQGPAALLAAVGALDPDGAEDMMTWPADSEEGRKRAAEHVLIQLAQDVGGESVLGSLDDDSLPDEPFDWTGIADDIRPFVTQVLHACDNGCDQLLDAEYRTACRRLLARAASGDPSVFRRKASPVKSAAAITWLIGRANNRFNPYGGLQVKDLMAHFGGGQSPSQRARAFLVAAGLSDNIYGDLELGTPELLVAARRREIIKDRDRYRSQLAGDGPSS